MFVFILFFVGTGLDKNTAPIVCIARYTFHGLRTQTIFHVQRQEKLNEDFIFIYRLISLNNC